MDPGPLREIADLLGGRGCVVKDGYVVKAWGDQSERSDWFSSAKPVLSTLLFRAITEGLVKSVDQPIADFGWPLQDKDRGITFRHLGAMTSGYRRPEGPGQAWAYNDYAILSIGARGNCAAVLPSLGAVLVCANGNWGSLKAGDAGARMNRVLAFVATAVGDPQGTAHISGDRKKWHRITLSFRGPDTNETASPNPFTDYQLTVTFAHGARSFTVPGYYAADGNAGESGAIAGSTWRVHFAPDAEGSWSYAASFRQGTGIAMNEDAAAGQPCAFDGARGQFVVGPTDKQPPDGRSRGLLQYRGTRYLQYSETGTSFLKGGVDSPENFLAYADFDQTRPSHHYKPHARDWRPGDPTWLDGEGKNIIGALNYLAGKGMNSVHLRLPEGRYRVSWYNPRQGGPLLDGHEVSGPGLVALGQPPQDAERDWVVVVRPLD